MKKVTIFIVLVFAAVTGLKAENTVKIAAIFAKSGKGALSGEMFFLASRFSVDAINRKGGW